MNALWVTLKENVKCGSKLTDVVMKQQPCVKSGEENGNMNNRNDDDNKCSGHSNPVPSQVATTTTKFHELSKDDPSRKIVEMIFHKAWKNTPPPLKKVRTVFKVCISPETLERFEKYREMVKEEASEKNSRHPRSVVDGNELLRFYSSTMRCCCFCQGRKSMQKRKYLCDDPSCSVCQIIRFNFDTGFSRLPSDASLKTEKSAVIICRIIAGTSTHEVNGQIEGPCSNGAGKMQFSFDKLVVRNPSAILPCFVIVFD